MESADPEMNCYDKVLVHDGSTRHSPLIRPEICGNENIDLSSIVSSGNMVSRRNVIYFLVIHIV